MRKRIKALFTACGMLFYCSAASTAIPNTSNPSTFVGPTLQGTFSKWYTNTTALAFLGELGAQNLRASGTVGLKWWTEQRVKFSAEYLVQEIKYAYFSGDSEQWVHQGAVGADYQYDFAAWTNPTFDLNAYVSAAPSKDLSTVDGAYIVKGFSKPFSNSRRIAGSIAGGFSPGVVSDLWTGARGAFALNYDYVHYHSHNPYNKVASGVGATVSLDQKLFYGLILGVSGAWRAPFDNYQANLFWNDIDYKGRWNIGLFGEYNKGKDSLTTTSNAGIFLNYYADHVTDVTLKAYHTYKGEDFAPTIKVWSDQNFMNWVSDPAVYMPQVLAIADQKVKVCTMGGPSVVSAIAGVTTSLGVTIPTRFAFTGSGLSYSIVVTPALSNGDVITINPDSGIVTIVPNGSFINLYTVTETAANVCGSATTSFTVEMLVS